MTHYRMLDRTPSAIITSNKNELKIYQDNIVYLNNGENFELKFFNPTKDKLGVEIIFNGIKKGDSYLVLNPGQDLTLDRFLDEQRKMVFETYTIDGENKNAIEAVKENGLITFNFYKEYYNVNTYNANINYNFPPKIKKNKKRFKNSKGFYSSGIQGNNGNTGYQGYSGNISTIGNLYSSNLNYSCSSSNFVNFSSDIPIFTEKSIETGRIEKGEISNQQLRNVNVNFDSQPFFTISYKILPYSQMNKTVKEIRMYCTECGYRLRKDNWKFCPKCGHKIS